LIYTVAAHLDCFHAPDLALSGDAAGEPKFQSATGCIINAGLDREATVRQVHFQPEISHNQSARLATGEFAQRSRQKEYSSGIMIEEFPPM
jgi:hypothetical protein